MPELARERWQNRKTFLLACIGAAVGLGNIWRFPYIAYSSGGGAFLLPYFLALIFIGIPILFLEMSLGSKYQQGVIGIYNHISPALTYISCLFSYAAFIVSCYYAVLMAWCIRYFIASFESPLPWHNDAETYFYNHIIGTNVFEDLTNTNTINGTNFGYTLLVWIIVGIIICRGTKSSGWIVWVTVPLPFILLFILFIRGVTLDGASTGISYYIKPDFVELFTHPRVWYEAIGQIFFSLSLAVGVMPAFASYHERSQNIAKDTFIIAIVNSFTSLFGGFAIFSILGHMAKKKNVDIDEVVKSGPGLAFIAIPEAVGLMPASNLFSCLFFLMLLTLGIDSAFALCESITTVIKDYIGVEKAQKYEIHVTIIVCMCGALGSLIFTTNTGIFWIELIDGFVSIFLLLPLGFITCFIVWRMLDLDQFLMELSDMMHIVLSIRWIQLLKFSAICLFIVSIIEILNELIYPEDYPAWALTIGWLLTFVVLIFTVIVTLYKYYYQIERQHSRLDENNIELR